MIDITIMEQPRMNGVNWWRVFRPFSVLQKMYHDQVKVNYVGVNIQIVNLMFTDVLYLARPNTREHLTVMQRARELGCRVIIDYDDDLKRIPLHNPAHGLFDSAMIDKCISMADEVWVSTEEIIPAHGIPPQKAFVVPNAIMEDDIVPGPNTGSGVLVWRGSPSHLRDVAVHWKWFEEQIKDRFEKIVFIGCMPPTISAADNISYIPWKDVTEYIRTLYLLKPEWLWVPLEDNPFNACKSNIAWLEATMCGARVMTNLDSDRWHTDLDWASARERILQDYNLKNMTAFRMQRIRNLINR